VRQASPQFLAVDAERIDEDAALARVVADIREEAGTFVFLSGGAGGMSTHVQRRLVSLLEGIALLARGRTVAVGDGGTRAGVMEAAGLARRASGGLFPLVGICPAIPVTTTGEEGKTPVDPNHSHVIAVRDRAWESARRAEGWTPKDGYWGSETPAMHRIFARLAQARPAVALAANGGRIVLDEIRRHVEAARPIVLVTGSGRAVDALISLIDGTEPSNPEVERLRDLAQARGLPGSRDLYCRMALSARPEELAALLDSVLSRA
jgi:hypothetical protein